jgi:hypothetical protein
VLATLTTAQPLAKMETKVAAMSVRILLGIRTL